MSNSTRTLLKVLIDQRPWRYNDFESHFRRAAGQVLDGSARNLTVSESQFRRWTSGKVKTMPGPNTCRVLEYLFGIDVAALFGPPPSPDLPAPAFNLEDEIAMTARDAQSEASTAAAASISDTTLDQLRDDVTALARQYTSIPTYTVFQKARGLREQAESERDRTQVPAQQHDLLLIAGQACALLATAAFDLGSLDGAKRLSRSAALYGEAARFDPLRAFAGGTLAYIAYFTGQPAEAARLARQAQTLTGLGDVARHRLAAIEARAHAYLGDAASAQRALDFSEAEGPGCTDDLHDQVGGEFGFPAERLAMSNSSTCLILGDGDQAETTAARALGLARSRPPAQRSVRVIGGAGADLAAARLLRGNLDGAADAMNEVWAVPRDQRATGLLVRAARVRRAVTGSRYRGAPLAVELGERIEDFTRLSASNQLGTSTGPLAALEP
ncbi:DNA-binding protein [Streptomyces sp. NPDC054933]